MDVGLELRRSETLAEEPPDADERLAGPEQLAGRVLAPEAALGVARSELIIQAVEQAPEDRSAWSPGFLKAIGTPREDVAISKATAAEIEFGLRYLPASRRRRALEAQWSAIGPEPIRLPWSDEVSRRFGERKARLERAGRRISDVDLAIAVHALAYDLTLVTADRVFERPKLRGENWLA